MSIHAAETEHMDLATLTQSLLSDDSTLKRVDQALNYEVKKEEVIGVQEDQIRKHISQLSPHLQIGDKQLNALFLKGSFDVQEISILNYINTLKTNSVKHVLSLIGDLYVANVTHGIEQWRNYDGYTEKGQATVAHYTGLLEKTLYSLYLKNKSKWIIIPVLFQGFVIAKRYENDRQERAIEAHKFVNKALRAFKAQNCSFIAEIKQFLTAYQAFIVYGKHSFPQPSLFSGKRGSIAKKLLIAGGSVLSVIAILYGIDHLAKGALTRWGKKLIPSSLKKDGSVDKLAKALTQDMEADGGMIKKLCEWMKENPDEAAKIGVPLVETWAKNQSSSGEGTKQITEALLENPAAAVQFVEAYVKASPQSEGAIKQFWQVACDKPKEAAEFVARVAHESNPLVKWGRGVKEKWRNRGSR